MSEQTLKRIFVALGVLVVLWALSALLSGRGGGGRPADLGVAAALEGLDATSIEAVRIQGPDQTVELARGGGAWTVDGYPADSVALARLWGALEGSIVGDVVATNPANHARMGLAADSTWTLDLTRVGGGTSSLVVGKNGPTFPSTYARLPDEDAVVVVTGDLRAAITRRPDDWRDKTILRTDTAAVASVVIEAGGATYTVNRPDSVWMVDGELATASIMAELMRQMGRLLATGFVAEGDSIAEENPRRVVALDAAGDTLSVITLTGDESTRHVRVPGNDVVFEIPSWRVDQIAPDKERLLPADSTGS